MGRRQESIDTAYRQLVTNKLRTNSAWRNAPTQTWIWQQTQTKTAYLGFSTVRLHAIRTHNQEAADKYSTQWLVMGMRGTTGGGIKWRNVCEWTGGICLCEWTAVWKNENMCRQCNVLLHNTFYGRPNHFRSGLIKLSCILYLVTRPVFLPRLFPYCCICFSSIFSRDSGIYYTMLFLKPVIICHWTFYGMSSHALSLSHCCLWY